MRGGSLGVKGGSLGVKGGFPGCNTPALYPTLGTPPCYTWTTVTCYTCATPPAPAWATPPAPAWATPALYPAWATPALYPASLHHSGYTLVTSPLTDVQAGQHGCLQRARVQE